MAYRIMDECAKCGCCELECLNRAISEGEMTYVIDPNRCTECAGAYESSKCAEICPLNAPKPDPNHVESKEQLMEKWHKLHSG